MGIKRAMKLVKNTEDNKELKKDLKLKLEKADQHYLKIVLRLIKDDKVKLFNGFKFKGTPTHTIIAGKIKMQNGKILGDPDGTPLKFS